MYFRNRFHNPVDEIEYLGLKREGKYWFPYNCKYFGWFLVLSVITISSVILIYYGMSFGMIKTYLWLTGILSSFILGVLIITPLRIAVLALADSLFLKSRAAVDKRKVFTLLLHNPEDNEKKEAVDIIRKNNKPLYRPIPISKLKNRLEDIKYNLELRNLTLDVVVYIIFMITVFYVVMFNKETLSYYDTEVVKNLVIDAMYTNSIPFTEIATYKTFLKYLNQTLLPALMLDSVEYNENWPKDNLFFRETSTNNLKKRQLVDNNKNNKKQNNTVIFERGWTMDPSLKLIGIPRLRQLRVSTDSCQQLYQMEGRNLKCAEELSLFNQETRNFTLEWKMSNSTGLLPMQEIPWVYQSGWETATLPIFAKFTFYPAGGYILNLAKNIYDSQIVVNFMDKFQWVDMRTRVVFIEFTIYCVNTNTFNVVTLIAEKSATGYVIPSYQIESCKFIFTLEEVQIIYIVMTILYTLLLFCFLIREGFRIHRTSLMLYFNSTTWLCFLHLKKIYYLPITMIRRAKTISNRCMLMFLLHFLVITFLQSVPKAFAVLNFTIILCGILSILFIFLRSHYVGSLLEKLEQSNNNAFVSFYYAAYWYTWSIYIGALLICLAFFKLFRLLAYRVVFFRLHTTISHCNKHFTHLFNQVVILIFSFGMFFYLTLFLYDYEFSNYFLTISTIIGQSAALDDTYNLKIFLDCPCYVTAVYFLCFVVLITIVSVNLFIAVVCFFFHEVAKESLINKYSIKKYVKYILTRDERSDILPLRGEKNNKLEKLNNSSFLRLRGGGCQIAKAKPTPKPEPKPEPKLKPKTNSKLTSKLKPTLTPKLKPKPTAKLKIKPKPKLKPEPEPELKPKPESELKLEAEPELKPIKKLKLNLKLIFKSKLKLKLEPKLKKIKKTEKIEEKKKLKRHKDDKKIIQNILLEEFVKKKPLDVTQYEGLSTIRIALMKALTISFLIDNREQKNLARQNALKMLFLSLVSAEKKITESVKSDLYFTVVKGAQEMVIKKKRLTEMKKIVEIFGKKNYWILNDIENVTQISNFKAKINQLNENLTFLAVQKQKFFTRSH